MIGKGVKGPCCGPSAKGENCCKVEAVIPIDERGQMVLPKELREKANIRAGDKFALVSWQKNGEICCFTLMKTDSLAGWVKEFLGPVLKEMDLV